MKAPTWIDHLKSLVARFAFWLKRPFTKCTITECYGAKVFLVSNEYDSLGVMYYCPFCGRPIADIPTAAPEPAPAPAEERAEQDK